MKRRGKRGSTAQTTAAVFQKHRKTHRTLSVACEERSEVEFGMHSPLLCQLFLRVDNLLSPDFFILAHPVYKM